jgi:hypothetical protein
MWLRPAAPLTVRAAHLLGYRSGDLDVGGAALLDWAGTPATVHAGWTGAAAACICTWKAASARRPSGTAI